MLRTITSRKSLQAYAAISLLTTIYYSHVAAYGAKEIGFQNPQVLVSLGLTLVFRAAILSLQSPKCQRAYTQLGINWLQSGTGILTKNVARNLPTFIRTSAFIVPFAVTMLAHAWAMWLLAGFVGIVLLVLPDVLFWISRHRA